MRVKQGYVNVGSGECPQLIHYRTAGTGRPLVMLHASPMSSAALLPFIGVAAGHATVIAPDTPGYGWSDPLPEPTGDLSGYVAALHTFTERLGLESFSLYGTATGAQIAIEFSKTHAAKVDCLILDNAAHFTDEEKEGITAGYFPDLVPDATGSHLTRIWSVARDQCVFFPWHQATPETRLRAGGVNTQVVHMMAMEFLQSGKDYDRAYRAAFANEKIDRVRPITVPVTIVRWEGSILKPYTDRFDTVEWPDNFTMLHSGPTREQRVQAFKNLVAEGLTRTQGEDFRLSPSNEVPVTGMGFLDFAAGQCHYRSTGDAALPPLLALHDIGSSQRSLAGLASALSGHYHVVAPDLPGHGLSYLPEEGQRGLEPVVEAMAELVSSCRWTRFDILAEKGSAAIAVQLAERLGASVRKLTLLNPLDYSALAGEWDAEKLCRDIEPDAEGAHFLKTWHLLRDRQLFWPWYAADADHALPGQANLDADYLTERVTEFWQAYPALNELARQVVNYPLAAHLDRLGCSVDLCMTASDPLLEVGRRSLPGRNCTLLSNTSTF